MGTKLNVTEACKIMAMRGGVSMAEISRMMGFKSRANLSAIVVRGTMQTDMMAKYAEICGYKLVAVPKDMDVENGIEIQEREMGE